MLLVGVRVLVVDDDQDTTELFPVVLESEGAQVWVSRGAEEALLLYRTAEPDIVLCDLVMPGIDGFALIRQLRQQGFTRPAVALSALAYPEDIAAALAAGFDAHYAKPIDIDELIALVRGLVRTDQNR